MNFENRQVKDLKEGNLFFYDNRLYLFEGFHECEYEDYPAIKASLYVNRFEHQQFLTDLSNEDIFSYLVRFIYLRPNFILQCVSDFRYKRDYAYYLV